ncbi:MAG: serine hydrolase [Woeseia sp.]
MSRLRIAVPLLALILSACATQPSLSEKEIDRLVIAAMEEFSVPGAAVGVIKDGVVVHAAGYGVRELGRDDPVDTETLFRAASTTKAFTAASLAMLVDAGKLSWDDKVVDHLPGFALHDAWITAEFTVTDLLTHRSGLVSGAGDLMLWPKPNLFTREDIIHGLRFFKPESGFRSEYAYDNLLYIVGGEIVPAVAGTAWQDFVDQQILARLGAERCFAGRIPEADMQNLAAPHALVEGELQVVERNRIRAEVDVAAAAGGLRCSLGDMLTWAQLQLARGQLADGSRLFSEAQSQMMWSPQTILSVSESAAQRYRTHFRAYGLGWRLADVHGFRQVSHTGSYTGNRAEVILIPEINLGVVILINASAGGALAAIGDGIVLPYLGVDASDAIDYYRPKAEPVSAGEAQSADEDPDFRNGSVLQPLGEYAGLFRDNWFGDVAIEQRGAELWFRSGKSPKMEGRLWPYDGHRFYAYWSDRTLDADAWIDFLVDEDGRIGRMTMAPVWDHSDWDLSDLAFRRVAGTAPAAPAN